MLTQQQIRKTAAAQVPDKPTKTLEAAFIKAVKQPDKRLDLPSSKQ